MGSVVQVWPEYTCHANTIIACNFLRYCHGLVFPTLLLWLYIQSGPRRHGMDVAFSPRDMDLQAIPLAFGGSPVFEAFEREFEVFWGQFLGHNLPVVAHTKRKTSRDDLDSQSNCLLCSIFAYT